MTYRCWDINEHVTGRLKGNKPIMGVTLQNGLNDKEPDGSFVPCDMGLEEYVGNVTTHKVKRGRYGRLAFTDSASSNKHLCKVLYKDNTGLSFKYLDGDSDMPDVSNGKPSFTSNNGIIIEHTPMYNGVKIELVINDPLTAPNEHSFSIKTYGQGYTFEENNGGVLATGADGRKVTIHAPYVIDSEGNSGHVTMALTGYQGQYMTFKKIIDEAWLRQAIGIVRLDPNVTIQDGDGGRISDTYIQSNDPTMNHGAGTLLSNLRNTGLGRWNNVLINVDLSAYPGVTILTGYLEMQFFAFTAATIEAFTVNREWVEDEATYNLAKTGTSWGSAGCNSIPDDRTDVLGGSKYVSVFGGKDQITITSILQDNIDGPNYGFMTRCEPSTNGQVNARSTEYGAAGERPLIYFEYTEVAAAAGRRRRMLLGRN